MQNNSTVLHIRMDNDLKERVSTILANSGLAESDAVKFFTDRLNYMVDSLLKLKCSRILYLNKN